MMSTKVATVRALYRYPVKGFTPEPVERLEVLPGGRVAGDRVLNFRFADAPVGDTQWCTKYHGVVLANTPGLARLAVRFDPDAQRLAMSLDGRLLADEGLDETGCRRLADALTAFVQDLDENPLRGHPGRLPLKLVGDGVTPRYQDNEGGQVTLLGRDSLAALAGAWAVPGVDERRFRHNIVIGGAEPWAELGWAGRKLRVGAVSFETIVPKVRCMATHANPQTGQRDLQVMPLLRQHFAQQQPTFGIGMLSVRGGEISLGDSVVEE